MGVPKQGRDDTRSGKNFSTGGLLAEASSFSLFFYSWVLDHTMEDHTFQKGEHFHCLWRSLLEKSWYGKVHTDVLLDVGIIGAEKNMARSRKLTKAKTSAQLIAQRTPLQRTLSCATSVGHILTKNELRVSEKIYVSALPHTSVKVPRRNGVHVHFVSGAKAVRVVAHDGRK